MRQGLQESTSWLLPSTANIGQLRSVPPAPDDELLAAPHSYSLAMVIGRRPRGNRSPHDGILAEIDRGAVLQRSESRDVAPDEQCIVAADGTPPRIERRGSAGRGACDGSRCPGLGRRIEKSTRT